MKTRQLVFNDEANAKYASEHFACVSTSTVAYKYLPQENQQKAEFRLLEKAFEGTKRGMHQGIYVVTPRGKLIAKVDQGWPTYDTAAALRNMKDAVRQYRQMEKRQRLAPRLLTEKDRSFHRKGYGLAPEGAVKLMSVTRGLPFADMQLFDIRHNDYFKIDRLWYAQSELNSIFPRELRKGAKTQVGNDFIGRVIRFGHVSLGALSWQADSVEKLDLTSEVVAIREDKIFLKMEGGVKLRSHTLSNSTTYQGNLLGRVIYDRSKARLEKFELVALGAHELNRLASNSHRGNTTRTQVAMVIKLNEQGPNELEIAPKGIQNYPAALKPKSYRDIRW